MIVLDDGHFPPVTTGSGVAFQCAESWREKKLKASRCPGIIFPHNPDYQQR